MEVFGDEVGQQNQPVELEQSGRERVGGEIGSEEGGCRAGERQQDQVSGQRGQALDEQRCSRRRRLPPVGVRPAPRSARLTTASLMRKVSRRLTLDVKVMTVVTSPSAGTPISRAARIPLRETHHRADRAGREQVTAVLYHPPRERVARQTARSFWRRDMAALWGQHVFRPFPLRRCQSISCCVPRRMSYSGAGRAGCGLW